MKSSYSQLIKYIKSLYPALDPVPLHAPVFDGNEKNYLLDCIDSTYVSYVGKYVDQFEKMISEFTGAKYAIAMVNGTTSLQIALQVAGVGPGDEVITQALTFVATPNAISHAGAKPVFVDVDKNTLGMSPESLETWLKENVIYDKTRGLTVNRKTNNPISAIVPMHTFGHPCLIEEIVKIAKLYSIPVIEDSAESLGSYYRGRHTGTFGLAGIFSFNGNKTITTGGGGMIITDDESFYQRVKHITTTAKIPHRWEFVHDEVGYNLRMPNVNAAVGVAQMENIETYLINKRDTAQKYIQCFTELGISHVSELKHSRANYWLNAIKLENRAERDEFLEFSNDQGVNARPIWTLSNKLKMFDACQHAELINSQWLEDRAVNIPSGVK
jgi:perosamine synthetase